MSEEIRRSRRRGRSGGRSRRGGAGTGAPPRIYTRGGDTGETGLIGGRRVPKDDPRVEAYGAVDELNSQLGVARTVIQGADLKEVFNRIQNRLFDLGAELASPQPPQGASPITAAEVKVLEGIIDLYQETLPPLREFILPVGTGLAAALHVARTVCRRAERRVVALSRKERLNPETLRYLNRLSDLLFVLARVANARARLADVTWKMPAPSPLTVEDRPPGAVPARRQNQPRQRQPKPGPPA